MMRPRKMKFIELTVLKSDINAVLEYLGKRGAVQFPESSNTAENTETARIRQILDRLRSAAEFTGIGLPIEPDENSSIPGEAEEKITEKICSVIENIRERKINAEQEKQRVKETIGEAEAFSKMNAPFSDLDQLSYLTLRLGRLDTRGQVELRKSLGDRAVIIPLDSGDKVLAASSRKGRFALDSELKKNTFEPIAVPEGYKGVPSEMLNGLEEQLKRLETEIEKIESERDEVSRSVAGDLRRLASCWLTSFAVETLKSMFTSTESIYHFSGWTPADTAVETAGDLLELTGGRVAIRSYSPEEVPSVADGSEKVPVSLKHGAFVKGFEGVVFSYGAPLYGTIDPTPLVAVFFTLLFGIMFGDFGQGAVLLLLGVLLKLSPKMLAKFPKFPTPLIAVGSASMVMGLLCGSVFTNEELLTAPTKALTGAITGHPVDRILHILPMAESGGSVKKLFIFFGFTIGIGVVLNSIGLLINIANRFILKKYEKAFFSKTGLAGLLLFWYALFIAMRLIFGGSFELFDFAGLFAPVLFIFFGPVIWRVIAGERPVLEHGFMTFFMEGFVEILETVSSYISNTVSFLRVGAFALSHAVLSFIVFRFSEELASSGAAGSVSALLLMLFGNTIIIVLEGMIVAIQVMRLQYYEFFNKFFIETGVEFAPFRFKAKNT